MFEAANSSATRWEPTNKAPSGAPSSSSEAPLAPQAQPALVSSDAAAEVEPTQTTITHISSAEATASSTTQAGMTVPRVKDVLAAGSPAAEQRELQLKSDSTLRQEARLAAAHAAEARRQSHLQGDGDAQ